MPASIQYSFINHRGATKIAIHFEYNKEWNDRISKVPGAKWSKTLRCWTIPDTLYNREKCGLSQDKNLIVKTSPDHPKISFKRLSNNNAEQLQKYLHQLQLKAYSPSTIRTYKNEFMQLLQKIGNVNVQDLQPEHLQRYMLWCVHQGLQENTLHSRLNALKFYYEQVLHKEKFFFEIPRPKKPLQLPKILDESEIRRMFTCITNTKHKAILFTAYSGGLRVSEVVNLRVQDIDSRRMQIFVKRAKGKKDRVVNLSVLLLDVLRQYVKIYNVTQSTYLFTAPDGQAPYSERSAQKVFQKAKEMAGIKKDVSFHSLRHSFATHLLEKGIDVKYIKELLGHFDIRTTERYLHVSKDKLVNIVSPLDSLYESQEHRLRIADTDNTKKRIEKH